MTKPITEAELSVMEALWAESPLTASTVTERVADERGWSPQTVKTLLSRLVEKGAVSHEKDGRRFLYAPTIARGDYAAGESRRLVDRLFGGKVTPLVAHLAEADSLSDEDVAEIEKLIRELKS